METELKEKVELLTKDELVEMKNIINELLNKRLESEPKKFLFDPNGYFERYNGGWTKTVVGLDKKITNGYSILGDFKPQKVDWYTQGKLYLDKGIGGSRKNQKSFYNLFTIDKDGNVIILKKTSGKNWSTDLWETIEKHLNQ